MYTYLKNKTMKSAAKALSLATLMASTTTAWAQEASAAADATTTWFPEVYSSSVAYLLLAMAFVLVLVIYTLGNALRSAAEHHISTKKAGGAGVVILYLSSLSLQAQDASGGSYDYVSANMVYGLLAIVILEVLVVFYLSSLITSMLKKEEKMEEVATEASEEAQAAAEKEKLPMGWMEVLYKVNTEEDVKRLDLGHNYDGIHELDNKVPSWWQWAFAASVLFGVVYLFRYHILQTAPNQREELRIAMEKADADIAKYMAAKGEMIDENTVAFLDNSTDIAKGRELYLRPGACVACHGEDGSGIVGGYPGVGPNLVDEYWLHGGSVQDVFKTIKYGVPEKGMIAWKDNYSAKEMAQITAFVLSLQGSNPTQQKEPQGQLYKTNNADNSQDAADNEEDDSDTAEGDVAAL